MKKHKKRYDDDDGRVISKMNIDGMPWYTGNRDDNTASDSTNSEKITLTKSEERAMMRGVFFASLLISVIFIIGGLAFVLFCVFVWFK